MHIRKSRSVMCALWSFPFHFEHFMILTMILACGKKLFFNLHAYYTQLCFKHFDFGSNQTQYTATDSTEQHYGLVHRWLNNGIAYIGKKKYCVKTFAQQKPYRNFQGLWFTHATYFHTDQPTNKPTVFLWLFASPYPLFPLSIFQSQYSQVLLCCCQRLAGETAKPTQ